MDAEVEKTPEEKRAFVLSMPADLTKAEIVERAKEAGIEISEGYVYYARRRAEKKANAARTGHAISVKRSSAPKWTRLKKSRRGTKAAFVRSMDPASTPDQILLAARVQGIPLTRQYIHNVRFADRNGAARATHPAKNGAPKRAAQASPAKRLAKRGALAPRALPVPSALAARPGVPRAPIFRAIESLEPEEAAALFVKLALDMGLGHARSLMRALDEKARTLFVK
ncbi:MAG TPA: hypothetical protein VNO21_26515 [Polyangiaceae bacterium]|nr:hypothetical protein [Polyangiaceae bacterium]